MKVLGMIISLLTLIFFVWLFIRLVTYEDTAQKESYEHLERFWNGDFKEEMEALEREGRKALEERRSGK